MVSSLQAATFSAMFYGLGALGFIAVTALPIRFWILLHRNAWAIRSGNVRRVAYLLLVLAGAAAVVLASLSLIHVGRCLLGFHCSANAAGGWISLAGVGFWYFAFELVAFLIVRFAFKQSAVAT